MLSNGRYNYYEILELPTNAPQHDVSVAYERAKNTYSGDNPAIYTIFSDQEARELLSMIEEAYSVLGNKTLRTLYDQRLFAGSTTQTELSFEALTVASRVQLPEAKTPPETSGYEINEQLEEKFKTTSDWNGALLKEVREYKNISLQKLSDRTKIKAFYINAVESMNPEELPAEVFVRGYVVQMSKELGLNEKIVADSYMKKYRQLVTN